MNNHTAVELRHNCMMAIGITVQVDLK